MAQKQHAIAIAAGVCAVHAFAAGTVQAASVPELWLGAIVIGTLGGLGAFFGRSLWLVLVLAMVAAVVCLVPWVPADVLPEVEAKFGSSYNLHSQASMLLAPVLVVGGGVLGHVRRKRARAT
jgi:hypothetical protein